MQLEKLLRASQEGTGRTRRKGIWQTRQSIPEDRAGFDEATGGSGSCGGFCADGPEPHELVKCNNKLKIICLELPCITILNCTTMEL